jgi:hypothetical protein
LTRDERPKASGYVRELHQIIQERYRAVRLAGGQESGRGAAAAGVTDRTVRRWLNDPTFADALICERRGRFARILNRIAAAGEKSVDVLLSIATDEAQPPSARVAAARTLLSPALQPIEAGRVATSLAFMEGPAGEGSG